MELKRYIERIPEVLTKYKYIVLIILAGLLFMLIPFKKDSQSESYVSITPNYRGTTSIEDELTQILLQIKGVGKVKVMLSVAQGEQIIYQTNDTLSSDNDTEKEDVDTVLITDSERNQNGLVRQTIPPLYMGAIIVCQGADNPTVKLAITEAVAKVTGLKTNHISVLKMK